MPIQIVEKTIVTSLTPTGYEWTINTIKMVHGKKLVELKKGDKAMTRWVTGKSNYSAQVSSIIQEIMDLQISASRALLGMHDGVEGISAYKKLAQTKALSQLMAQSSTELIEVELPSFTSCDGALVGMVRTHMPLDVRPQIAWVGLTPEVLWWFALKYLSTRAPEKRQAEHPPSANSQLGISKRRSM